MNEQLILIKKCAREVHWITLHSKQR